MFRVFWRCPRAETVERPDDPVPEAGEARDERVPGRHTQVWSHTSANYGRGERYFDFMKYFKK